jgi:hypothetical protein
VGHPPVVDEANRVARLDLDRGRGEAVVEHPDLDDVVVASAAGGENQSGQEQQEKAEGFRHGPGG